VASGISNTMNTPIEVLELSFPVRVERYEIVPDTGGPGRFRGGCGVERVWHILDQRAHASVCLERTKSAPFGLAGGGAGAPGRISLVRPDGAERELLGKGAFLAPADARIRLRAPGAGGYGEARARDRERLREDVINGYVSSAAAAAEYADGDPATLVCPACRRRSD
jgi:N-methylhydantoinase B